MSKRWCRREGFRFLDHWNHFWVRWDMCKLDMLQINLYMPNFYWGSLTLLAGRVLANSAHEWENRADVQLSEGWREWEMMLLWLEHEGGEDREEVCQNVAWKSVGLVLFSLQHKKLRGYTIEVYWIKRGIDWVVSQNQGGNVKDQST